MSNERDTHFAGFAKLLWDELLHIQEFGYIEISDDEEEEHVPYQQLIAQRAYDLVEHVFNIAPVTEYEWRMSDIPDLTTLLPAAPESTAG